MTARRADQAGRQRAGKAQGASRESVL